MRDRRPIIIAGATAVVSCGLLAVATWRGWLGADVGRGANFCEAPRDWFVRQPANTFSNVGFVAAGLLIAWHAGTHESIRGRRSAHRQLPTAIACLVVLLGPGSAAMHATQSVLGGELDTLSMYLVAAFAAAYATMRWCRGGTGLLVATFIAAVAFCELVSLSDITLPVVMTPGNAAFTLLLLTATALEARIMRRAEVTAQPRYAYASIGSILAAFVIWNTTRTWLCAPHSLIQGHAIWHLLGALSAYFLYRYYASEGVADDATQDVALLSLRGHRSRSSQTRSRSAMPSSSSPSG